MARGIAPRAGVTPAQEKTYAYLALAWGRKPAQNRQDSHHWTRP